MPHWYLVVISVQNWFHSKAPAQAGRPPSQIGGLRFVLGYKGKKRIHNIRLHVIF